MGNIIGEQLPKYVISQINQRQKAHGSGVLDERTLNDLSYLNSKTAWIKLGSGVRITEDRTKTEGIRDGFAYDTLAKFHVLYGGVARLDFKAGEGNAGVLIQRGTTNDDPSSNIWGNYNGTYNVNALDKSDNEFGLVPMPGIESADIKCENRGSIKKATVKIKCYSPEQFKIIDLLYLRIGYTVFLEWGNSVYLDNETGNLVPNSYSLMEAEKYGFFDYDTWKKSSYSGFLPFVERKRSAKSGNYDGLLAKVVNFTWSFSQDGSYDIELSLISLGDVVESLKMNIPPSYNISKFINAAYELYKDEPDTNQDTKNAPTPSDNIISSYLFLQKIYLDGENNETGLYSESERQSTTDVFSNVGGNKLGPLGGVFVTPPKEDVIQLDEFIYVTSEKFDSYEEAKNWVNQNYSEYNPTNLDLANAIANLTPGTMLINGDSLLWASPVNAFYTEVNGVFDWEYIIHLKYKPTVNIESLKETGQGKKDVVYLNYNNNGEQGLEAISDLGFYMRFGHLLQFIQKYAIPKIKETGTGKDGEEISILKIDYDQWSNRMYAFPYQVSLDPRVCIVNGGETLGKGEKEKDFWPSLVGWKKPDEGYAWPMNIYINHSQIISSLNGNKDEKGNVALFDFLADLCNAINKALGGVNNLEPVLDEPTNTLRIIDGSYSPPPKKPAYELELYGYNPNNNQSNFVRNFNLKTEITNDFATMASIGSTAGGYVKGTENTMFSKWNKGLIDRWKEEYVAGDKDSRPTSTPKDDEARKMYFEEFWDKKVSSFGLTLLEVESWGLNTSEGAALSDEIIDKNISTVTEFYKYCQYRIQKEEEKYASPTSGFIPISLSITMDGISGIKIYNALNVSTRLLPANYPDSLKFIIKGVNHRLSGNDWETNIETVVIAKTEDKDSNAILTYPQIRDIVTSVIGEGEAESANTSDKIFKIIFEGGNVNDILAPQQKQTQQSSNGKGPNPSWPILSSVVPSKYPYLRYQDKLLDKTMLPSQDKINPKLLADLNTAARLAGITPYITTAISGHGTPSRHNPSGNAVDIAIFNGKGYKNKEAAKQKGIYDGIMKFVDELAKLGYARQIEYGKDKGVLYFGFPNHQHHVHVSNRIA